MRVTDKRTAQLMEELTLLRQRIAELEALQAAHIRMGEALRESRERYRSLVETIPHGIQEIDVSGIITFANSAHHKQYEYREGEMIGMSILDLVAADSEREKLRDYLKYLVEEQPAPVPYFGEKRKKKGNVISVQVAWDYKRDTQGQVIGFTSVITDITERKQAEEALRQSEERYRDLYEEAPNAYLSVGVDGRIKRTNRHAVELFGYNLDELIGKVIIDLAADSPTGKSMAQNVFQRFLRGQETHGEEVEFRRADGGQIWGSVSVRPIRDANGRVVATRSMIVDITERKRAEEALRESEARFRQFAEIIPHIIWMTTPDKQGVLYVNPAYERVFGRTRESLYGDPRSWLEAVHEEDRERVMAAILEREGRGDYLQEFRIVRSGGATRWVRDRAVPIRNERGEVYMHAGIGEDITERKLAEKALRQAHDELEKRVHDRTAALTSTVKLLEEQITERRKAQEALHESKEHFRRLVETVNVIPWEADPTTWRFTYVGPQAVWILGYPLEKWFEDNFWVDHIHPEDREYAVNCCLEGSSHKDDFEFEYRMVAAYGREVWLRDIVTVVSEEAGLRKLRGFMIDITERKMLENEILEVSAREQRRIGQDLHDGLGQHLAGIAFLSKVLEQKLAAKSSGEAAEAAEIAALVNQAVAQTRDLARGLCPVQLEANGLVAALDELTSRTESLFNISCRFQSERTILIHDNTVATHLYYIAQEAVSNAVKHGKARHIVIDLSAVEERITLMVKDDGIGFPEGVERHTGIGLHIMNYRAQMINGSLGIQGDKEGGTTVTCSLQSTNAMA